MEAVVLTEDDVIDAVEGYLASCGWRIISRARVTQHGDDLVAEHGDQRLVIEAKGAGSSKAGTARYGREFNTGQVFDHVAKAVLKALRVVTDGSAVGAIAVPDNLHHRKEVSQVAAALHQVGVIVFWVDDDGAVTVDGILGS